MQAYQAKEQMCAKEHTCWLVLSSLPSDEPSVPLSALQVQEILNQIRLI